MELGTQLMPFAFSKEPTCSQESSSLASVCGVGDVYVQARGWACRHPQKEGLHEMHGRVCVKTACFKPSGGATCGIEGALRI